MLYLRAVYANKATLAGYGIMIFAIVYLFATLYKEGFVSNKDFDFFLGMFLAGLSLLGATSMGFETMSACKRSLTHFNGVGRPDPRFEREFEWYCGRAGYRLAEKIWKEQQISS